jgi:glutathione peroxidase
MGTVKSAMGIGGDKPLVHVKSFYQLHAITGEGKKTFDFSQLKGKVVIISNVASKCGLTDSMYKVLGSLAQQYGPTGDFVVLGFPCSQFMGQEYKEMNETCPFVRNILSKFGDIQDKGYFTLMDKVDVNGENTNEVFHFLKYNSSLYNESKQINSPISWNFGKFLIDREGRVVKYYTPTDDKLDDDIKAVIEGKLNGQPLRQPTQ